jgi:thiol-disulfide isomerase/thioredoxin
LAGRTVQLSDLRGQRVMLNFWATWCGPCRLELPHMVTLYQEMAGQGFEILAVNVREAPDTVRPFVDQNDLRFPVLLDPAGQVSGYYFVRAIPTSIFIDENGIITAVHIGTLTDETLRQYVLELMS